MRTAFIGIIFAKRRTALPKCKESKNPVSPTIDEQKKCVINTKQTYLRLIFKQEGKKMCEENDDKLP